MPVALSPTDPTPARPGWPSSSTTRCTDRRAREPAIAVVAATHLCLRSAEASHLAPLARAGRSLVVAIGDEAARGVQRAPLGPDGSADTTGGRSVGVDVCDQHAPASLMANRPRKPPASESNLRRCSTRRDEYARARFRTLHVHLAQRAVVANGNAPEPWSYSIDWRKVRYRAHAGCLAFCEHPRSRGRRGYRAPRGVRFHRRVVRNRGWAMAFDVVIRNGMVVDGTGMPPYRADVGTRDGAIATIGRIRERGLTDIDADGTWAPGFIDGPRTWTRRSSDPLCSCSCWHGGRRC